MSEWAYKVSTRKRSEEDTRHLADALGFVARSAYKRTKDETVARISNVRKVEPDHVLHLYYVGRKGAEAMGSFRVLAPASAADRFEVAWPGTDAALVRVRDDVEANEGLLQFLEQPAIAGEGYLRDPHLRAFTGWLVQRIPGRALPRFEDIHFPGHHTLVPVDAAAAAGDAALLARVVHDPEVMGGKPCIRGTRVTVGTILGLLSSGHTFEAILSDFPYLTEIDLRAALAYAAWRVQDRELPLRAA